jgi:rhamnosyltransferase
MIKTLILLSSYNGEKYIREQIDSIIKQDVDVSLLVRDDGSEDCTSNILMEYKNKGKLNFVLGKNLGCAKSFWELLRSCDDADYYGFSDQDDVWDKDKIRLALQMLKNEDQNQPLLYCSRVRVTNENLKTIETKNVDYGQLSFAKSLVRCLAPGCTFVFNKKAKDIASKYSGYMEIHDWTFFKIVSMFGKVVFDSGQHMSYRQHGNNLIGASDDGIRGEIKRVKRFLNGNSTRTRSKVALDLLKCYKNNLNPEDLLVLEHLANYQTSLKNQITLLKDKHFDLGGFIINMEFKVSVLLKKL